MGLTANDRHIALQGGSNFRDIGGYPGAHGRRVRWGRVFRSGALSKLTAADWRWIEARGIATVCDLRSEEERELAPTPDRGMRGIDMPYPAELLFGARHDPSAGVGEVEAWRYTLFADILAPSLKALFDNLATSDTPLVVHCSAGQDRTGLAIGLLLNVLGVSRAEIVADYALSTNLRRVENELDRQALTALADSNPVARFYLATIRSRGPDAFRPRNLVTADGRPLLSAAFEAIERNWGSIPAYLETVLAVDSDRIERLRATLLEPGI